MIYLIECRILDAVYKYIDLPYRNASYYQKLIGRSLPVVFASLLEFETDKNYRPIDALLLIILNIFGSYSLRYRGSARLKKHNFIVELHVLSIS